LVNDLPLAHKKEVVVLVILFGFGV